MGRWGGGGMGRGNVNFFVAILERGARESGFRGVGAPFLEQPLPHSTPSPPSFTAFQQYLVLLAKLCPGLEEFG